MVLNVLLAFFILNRILDQTQSRKDNIEEHVSHYSAPDGMPVTYFLAELIVDI